ncbi:MAG: ATP-binding protein, partial [Thermoplasmata archaeon]
MEQKVDDWIKTQDFKTTADIEVPQRLIDQVIGQDEAVEIIKKAAVQKRHVILIGDPGTGKSMLAQSMVDFLPKEELEDILVFPNEEDQNRPRIKTLPAGKGKELVKQMQERAKQEKMERQRFLQLTLFSLIILGIIAYIFTRDFTILFTSILLVVFLWIFLGMAVQRTEQN